MLTVAVSALLGLGLGFALMDLFESSDNSDDTTDSEVPVADMGDILDVGGDNNDELDDETEGDTFIVGPGETVVGTDDADIFTANGERFYEAPVTIDAGAGDDILDLVPLGDPDNVASNTLDDSEIYGGDGADTITTSAEYSTISGGAGDDHIETFFAPGSQIFGDEGDDTIIATHSNSDGAYFYGGDGDDIIDGTIMNNGGLYGDDGDDLIMMAYGNQGGAAYIVGAYGGAGDDTISFDGRALSDESFEPAVVYGGDGSDTFEVIFNEGEPYEIVSNGNTPPYNEGWDGIEVLDTPFTTNMIILGDFEPGEDTILIEAAAQSQSFNLSSGRIEEDQVAETTKLIFTFENSDGDDHDVSVIVNAVGLSWEDISFAEGTAPPVLVPLA